MSLLTASDVKLPGEVYGVGLKTSLRGYNDQAQGSLAEALGRAQGQSTASASASGRAMGGYTGQALGRANTQASEGISNNMANLLGQTQMKDTLAEQQHQRKMALAKQIGDAMSPTAASQIMSGFGSGMNLAVQGKGLYDSLGSRTPSYSYGQSPAYGMSAPSNYGYSQPAVPDFGYGETYPNMMKTGGY